jgi:peroxiredoxin
MKLQTYLAVSVILLFTALSASSQENPAPNISGTSVQGTEVDLNEFKGEKNVLVVFYRMHT